MTTISKVEEKLMTIQTLGKLLEASTVFTKVDLEGKPVCPPYQKSIMDTGDRLVIQAKIIEFVKSMRASNFEGEPKEMASKEPMTNLETGYPVTKEFEAIANGIDKS